MGIVSVYFHRLNLCVTVLTLVVCVSVAEKADAAPRLENLARKVGVKILADATSAKDVLESTKKRIPNGKMSRNAQARAAHILDNVSQYRRMPSLQYPINPDIYRYLISHPDVAISTWRVMGISTLQMWQTGEFEYKAKATDGSTGMADVLWRDGNQCLFIVEGRYQSPLLPGSIEASALVWLQYRFVKAKDGSLLVNQQVETFLYFPSSTINAIAKLTSRLTNAILDRNVFEVSLYARMMAKAAEKEPEWIEQLAQRMDGVPPDRRMELALISRLQKPALAATQPVSNSRAFPTQELPVSGEFHVFEKSLQQVITHVPLVPSALQRESSNGRQIDADKQSNSYPYQFITPNSGKTVIEKETHTRLAVHYGKPLWRSDINSMSESPNESVEDSPQSIVPLPVTPKRVEAPPSEPFPPPAKLSRIGSTPAIESNFGSGPRHLKLQSEQPSPTSAAQPTETMPIRTPTPLEAGESSPDDVLRRSVDGD